MCQYDFKYSKMNSISITYALHWRLKFDHKYMFTKCGKCFNAQTGNQIKQVLQNRCIGYRINGKFKSLTSLRKELEIIPKEEVLPF